MVLLFRKEYYQGSETEEVFCSIRRRLWVRAFWLCTYCHGLPTAATNITPGVRR